MLIDESSPSGTLLDFVPPGGNGVVGSLNLSLHLNHSTSILLPDATSGTSAVYHVVTGKVQQALPSIPEPEAS